MTIDAFIALMIALAALWVGGLAADRTLPPPSVNNTPRENATVRGKLGAGPVRGGAACGAGRCRAIGHRYV